MDIDILLVEPKIPENIGFIARSMNVFGFNRLVMVSPPDAFTESAFKTAGKSKTIIEEAIIYTDFNQAISPYDVTIGTTRRMGGIRYPVYTPDQIDEYLDKLPSEKKAAIIFGREDKGLYNEELAQCRLISTIPTPESTISLNISHAAVIYMSLLHKRQSLVESKVVSTNYDPASDKEISVLNERMFDFLKENGFIKYGEQSLKNNLLHMLKKPLLEKKDIKLLNAICYHFENLARGDRKL